MKQSQIKILFFFLAAAVTIPLLVIALQKFNIFTPRASNVTPDLVTVANLTDTTATIIWTTSTATVTNLQWGDSAALGRIATDVRDAKSTKARTTHFVQLTGLQATANYYYRIVSGETTYPASDQSTLSFKTLPVNTETTPTTLTVYGDLAAQDGETVVMIYLLNEKGASDFVPLATTASTDGTWYLNIGVAKNKDGLYAKPTTNSDLALVVFGPQGTGYTGTTRPSASPITLTFKTSLTKGDVDGVLLTAKATPSVTVKPTSTGHQDVPLRPIGTTPTPTGSQAPTSLSREQLFTTFSIPSVSNITDSSFSIMYLSASPLTGTLNWGTSTTALTSNKLDDQDVTQATSRYLHHYTLTGLTSNLQYYFRPTSDNNVRTFTPPLKIATPAGQTIITGLLKNASGECLVRTQVKRDALYSSTITTIPSTTHAWAVNIMPVRTNDLEAFMIPVATDYVITNAFCITPTGDAYYQASSTTVQKAVTSGISLSLTKLQ